MTSIRVICLLTRVTSRKSFSGILRSCIISSHFGCKNLTGRQNILITTSFTKLDPEADIKMTSEQKKNSDGLSDVEQLKKQHSEDRESMSKQEYDGKDGGCADNIKRSRKRTYAAEDNEDSSDRDCEKSQKKKKDDSDRDCEKKSPKKKKDDSDREYEKISPKKEKDGSDRDHEKSPKKKKDDSDREYEKSQKKNKDDSDEDHEKSQKKKKDDSDRDHEKSKKKKKDDSDNEKSLKKKKDDSDRGHEKSKKKNKKRDHSRDTKSGHKKHKSKERHKTTDKGYESYSSDDKDHPPSRHDEDPKSHGSSKGKETKTEKRPASDSSRKIKRLAENSELIGYEDKDRKKSNQRIPIAWNKESNTDIRGKDGQKYKQKSSSHQVSMKHYIPTTSSRSGAPCSKSHQASPNNWSGAMNNRFQQAQRNFSTYGKQKSPYRNPEMLLREFRAYLTKEQNQHHYDRIKCQNYSQDTADDFEYFYGSNGPFSQHYQCQFLVNGFRYSCAEQYMMHQKAVLFGDEFHAYQILNTNKPAEMKHLGRKVQNFVPKVWDQMSHQIVKDGNKAKFSQNEGLKAVLFSTYPRILVEASPRDNLWGIGLGEENMLASSRRTWKGQNKLGYILTDVRNEMMQEAFLLDY